MPDSEASRAARDLRAEHGAHRKQAGSIIRCNEDSEVGRCRGLIIGEVHSLDIFHHRKKSLEPIHDWRDGLVQHFSSLRDTVLQVRK